MAFSRFLIFQLRGEMAGNIRLKEMAFIKQDSNVGSGFEIKESGEDIFLWPDDFQCCREEWMTGEYSHRSDDFIVIYASSELWSDIENHVFEDFSYDKIVEMIGCNPSVNVPWRLSASEVDNISGDEVVPAPPLERRPFVAQKSRNDFER